MAVMLGDYDTALDAKRRITVKKVSGSCKNYKNYHVYCYDDGSFICKPRVLMDPEFVSERTIRMMDKAMENFQKGIRSEPLDVAKMRRIADALPD